MRNVVTLGLIILLSACSQTVSPHKNNNISNSSQKIKSYKVAGQAKLRAIGVTAHPHNLPMVLIPENIFNSNLVASAQSQRDGFNVLKENAHFSRYIITTSTGRNGMFDFGMVPEGNYYIVSSTKWLNDGEINNYFPSELLGKLNVNRDSNKHHFKF